MWGILIFIYTKYCEIINNNDHCYKKIQHKFFFWQKQIIMELINYNCNKIDYIDSIIYYNACILCEKIHQINIFMLKILKINSNCTIK